MIKLPRNNRAVGQSLCTTRRSTEQASGAPKCLSGAPMEKEQKAYGSCRCYSQDEEKTF